MLRRDFLKLMALAGASASTGYAFANADTGKRPRVLVLIELQGANDGLNTLVPYADPRYYALRPKIAVARERVIQLSEDVGLHPQCGGLKKIWDQGRLAVVQGVGYPEPNRSHFRSIEIWETASNSRQVLEQGWLAPYLNQYSANRTPAAVAIGQDAGPLAGTTSNSIVIDNVSTFIHQAKKFKALGAQTQNTALRHILSVQNNMQLAALGFAESLAEGVDMEHEFPTSRLGKQLKIVARLITDNAGVRVYKLGLGGFDTHVNQKGAHAKLLEQLSQAVAAFQDALIAEGHWDRVMLMTYSEFGRRARENGNRGTDHGTAAPHFIAGGAVNGGLYGRQPSLSDLENDDLKYAVDFRSLYHTVQRDWLGTEPTTRLGRFPKLDFVATPI